MGIDFDGRAMFRIVWADEQLEKRHGRFDIFSGPIYLRTEVGVKEVPKYPYYKGCWVLEKLDPYRHPDIVYERSKGYEPFFVFKDGNGNPLPVNRRVVEFICRAIIEGPEKVDLDAAEAKELLDESNYFEDVLNDEGRSPLFAAENSAFVSKNQVEFAKRNPFLRRL